MTKEKSNNKEKNVGYANFILKFMLVATILVLGSTIVYSFRGNLNIFNKQESSSQTIINIPDEKQKLVNKLYSYVTYGRDIQPMYYFIKNKELTNETFDKLEKLKYAFQLITEDDMEQLSTRSFTVDGSLYKKYIETIFGKETSFDNSKQVTLLTNKVLNNSIINIKYNKTSDKYIITKENGYVLDEYNDIKPFYAKMHSYMISPTDDTISLVEKFIFVDKELSFDGKTISKIKVYKDITRKHLITEINNPTKEQINNFKLDNYIEKANIVTYTFKKDIDNNYYYYSSVVES